MDSFIAAILLGLFALGHATPIILDEHHLTYLTTQVPPDEKNSTIKVTVSNSITVKDKEAENAEGFTAEPLDDEDSATKKEQDSRVGRVQRFSDTSMTSTVEPTPPQSEDKTTFYPLNHMSEEGSGGSDEEIITPATKTTTEPVPLMNDDPEAGEIPTITSTASSISSSKSTSSSKSKSTSSFSSTRSTSFTRSTSSTRAKPVWILNEPGSGDDVDNVVIAESRRIGLGAEKVLSSDPQRLGDPTEMPKGHTTPDWVIILGFLVGVAVLVLLCVAVATRDKWNRPNQFNRTIGAPEAEQQRGTELETFVHSEQPPKENGRADDYTVIPLDELPDNHLS